MKTAYQVIIIGGGPSGMSAALVLGRSRIKTLVLNTEKPRNAITQHSHGFLTNDGKHPLDILATAKAELSKYPSVTYLKDPAIALDKNDQGFEIRTNSTHYQAKRVVIASGYQDQLSTVGIPNIEAVYGRSVFPCPFCDGYELADKKLAVFGDAALAPIFSKMIHHWSKDVIAFTNGDPVLDESLRSNLKKNGITLIETPIKTLHENNGQLTAVELENGDLIQREAGFLKDTKATEFTAFATQLNLNSEAGHFGMKNYTVDDGKETAVKGLYMIGDARTGWTGVATAVAEGYELGANITVAIINEAWKH